MKDLQATITEMHSRGMVPAPEKVLHKLLDNAFDQVLTGRVQRENVMVDANHKLLVSAVRQPNEPNKAVYLMYKVHRAQRWQTYHKVMVLTPEGVSKHYTLGGTDISTVLAREAFQASKLIK